MIAKAPPIEIPKEDPFRHDALSRRESVEILTQFVSTIEQPFVLAIDSPFGTGKTTFVDMWSKHLQSNGYPVLSFNAWETDFTGDPLVSFIGELALQISSFGGSASKAEEYLGKAKELAGTLAKSSLPLALKISAKWLKVDDLIKDGLGDLAEKLSQQRIDAYEADKNTIKSFKEQLHKFVEILAGDGEAKNLIVLVDELDRCRPSYAVELLERIKHFFNVNGIVFVLAVDRTQITHSVRSLYGSGMDVDGYLRRFIDLEYRLPRLSGDSFCKTLCKRFGFDAFFKTRTGESQYDERQFVEFFSKLAELFALTPRTQEQIFSQLSVVFRTVEKNYYIYPVLLATLVALKAKAPDLYIKLIEGHANALNVLEFMKNQPGGREFFTKEKSRAGLLVEAHLLAATHDETTLSQVVAQYEKKAEDVKLVQADREAAQEVARYLKHLSGRSWYGMLPYLVKKIEIADRFVDGGKQD